MFEANMQMPIYPGVMMNQMGMPMAEPQLKDINVPGVNDVMCGRGGGTNNHIGNIRFRQLVNGHKLRYLAATKSEKPMVSREVVTIWRGLNPPGRFLMQEKKKSDNIAGSKGGQWYDIGDKKAREKASQCLRERTPEVLPFVKKLELQLKMQQDEEACVQVDGGGIQSMTAAELSKELLQEQQQAAITAHMALKAYIPSSVIKLSQDINLNINNQLMPPSNVSMGGMQTMNNISSMQLPLQHPALSSMHHTMAPQMAAGAQLETNNNQNYHAVAYKKEQLAKEIEMLKQEQAKLEAEAEAAERQAAEVVAVTPGQMTAEEILNELGVNSFAKGLEPINPYDRSANTTMTKEEYRDSVRALLGPSSGHSSSGGVSTSTMDNNKYNANLKSPGDNKKERKSSFDRSEFMETMSRGSWVRSVNTFDDVSMASPESSMKMLHDLEPLDIREGGFLSSMKTSEKSIGKATLSSYESQILENLISPSNTDYDRMSNLPNIKEDESRIPSPHMPPPPPPPLRPILHPHTSQSSLFAHGSSNGNGNGNSQSHNLSNHQKNILLQHPNTSRSHMGSVSKGVSSHSMLSDLSEFSHKSMSMSARQRIETIAKMKSDASMFNDNMSDLSEAMGSLDVSTNKSFKE